MSLRVRIGGPLSLTSLLPKVSASLREILGLLYTPVVVANLLADKGLNQVESETISTEHVGRVFFMISGEPDNACLFCYERRIQHETQEEPVALAVIEVGSGRTPLDFAIAAAVAAALARENSAGVVDDMPFFTERFEQSADEFVDTIKVPGIFNDYQPAARVFFEACYGERRFSQAKQDQHGTPS